MEIIIYTDHITLGQFLKLAGLIGTGGQAKAFLAANAVYVNGKAVSQRGKKLTAGDVVGIGGQNYKILVRQ